jgi:hypothetical protein
MVVFLGMLVIAVSTVLALFLGLVGLLEAPWPVLLGILLVALYAIQRVSVSANTLDAMAASPPATNAEAVTAGRTTDRKSTSVKTVDEDTMTYRGVPYQPKPEVADPTADDSADTIKLEGVYRGCHWQKSVPAHLQPKEADPDITYRGKKIRATPPAPPSTATDA